MTGLIVVFSALGGTTGSFITGQLFAHFDGALAFYLLPKVPDVRANVYQLSTDLRALEPIGHGGAGDTAGVFRAAGRVGLGVDTWARGSWAGVGPGDIL